MKTQSATAGSSREVLLGAMEGLTASLRRAVQAIAENRVGLLEEEIQRQQEGCLRLLAEAQAAAGERSPRFKRAFKELRAARDCYAVVLEHSGRTLKMLRALEIQEPGLSQSATGKRSGAVSWHG